MSNYLQVALILSANAIGTATAFPQAYRVLFSRKAAGVSLCWASVSLASNICWVAYGAATYRWAIVPVSIFSAIGYLSVIAGISRCRKISSLELVASVLMSATMVALPLSVALIFGWSWAGVVLGGLYGVQLLPAVLSIMRTRDVSGISVATWGIAAIESVLWGIYGAWSRDIGLLSFAVAGLSMVTIVLVRVISIRQITADSDQYALAA